MAKRSDKLNYQHWVPAVKKIENWYKNFDFVLIRSMKELEDAFKSYRNKNFYMSFDTETTGLNFEELELVGYSFCLDGHTAYYVPVYHFEYEHNLGEPAVEFIYKRMCEASKVFMYNARFDMRVLEFRGYKEHKEELDKKRWRYVRYDMSKVKYYDVAVPCWNADTNQKLPTLKWCFTGDTKVITTLGDRNISDIKVDDKVVIHGKEFNVMNSFYMGEKDVVEVVFEDNSTIRCTPNHKFLVCCDNSYTWKKICDVRESDEIVDEKFIDSLNEKERYFLYTWLGI